MTTKKKSIRRDHQPPPIGRRGWRYHHLGIPTTIPHPDERHLAHLGIFVRGFDTSPFGVEWMRFEPSCKIPEIIRTVPHVAFEVDDIDREIKGFEVLYPISAPSTGVRSAMIMYDGAPIELIEFARNRARRDDRTKRRRVTGRTG